MGVFDRFFGRKNRRNRRTSLAVVGDPQPMTPMEMYNTNALEGTTVSYEDFHFMLMRRPFMQAFWRATTLETAYEMADLIWERYVDPMPGGAAGIGAINNDNIDARMGEFENYVNAQTRKVLVNKGKIQDLFADAQNRRLHGQLLQNKDAETEAELFLAGTFDRRTGAQAARPGEVLDVAVDWIIRSSATLSGGGGVTQAERLQLRNAIGTVVGQNRNVLDIDTLRFLFAACGKKDMVARYTVGGAFYGDTVIGRYLQQFTLEEARRLANFGHGLTDFWPNIALAVLGGLIIAHGFADSNGRSSRALYAAIMLQKYVAPLRLNQRPFVAPDYRWLVDFVQPTRDWHMVALP